jgi:hypothetical protein
MAEYRPFNASNKPGTCLWCGRKLEYKILADHRERVGDKTGDEGYTVGIYKTVIDERATKPGGYQDGYFCGLRCAYQFAVGLADHGRRFNPRQPDAER